MSTAVRRQQRQRLRAELFGECNSVCDCGTSMVLLSRYPMDGALPDNACCLVSYDGRDDVMCSRCNIEQMRKRAKSKLKFRTMPAIHSQLRSCE